MTKAQVEQALDQAIQQHICKLFGVLMAAPEGQQAMEHFIAGMEKLAVTEQAVAEYLVLER